MDGLIAIITLLGLAKLFIDSKCVLDLREQRRINDEWINRERVKLTSDVLSYRGAAEHFREQFEAAQATPTEPPNA